MQRWAALLARRLLQLLVLSLVVGLLSFLMMRALPGDMAMRIAAGRYGYDLVGAAAAASVRAELGLDLPIWQALATWCADLLRLRLGDSLVSGEPVWHELSQHLGATLQLTGAALLMAVLLGLPMGLISALRPQGWLARAITVLAVALRATPPFMIALALILLAAVKLGMLPVAGTHERGALLLPALSLALPLAAGLAQVFATTLREALALPSQEFARLKGLSDVQAVRLHALRHTAPPMLAYIGMQAVLLSEGAVVVEALFAWPGIGHALVHGVFGRDVPVIQGAALTMGAMFIAFNLLIDALSLWVDPRLRAGGRA
ncbi:MAG: ABC transporter permease [Methylibium sp.]|nr:ABC transporter permease [Methylibium sp.]